VVHFSFPFLVHYCIPGDTLLDDLGVADNTLVMFSTDNGAPSNSWTDGGNQPFRGEKGVGGYEGGFPNL